jgi:Tol biopolymer transport system component
MKQTGLIKILVAAVACAAAVSMAVAQETTTTTTTADPATGTTTTQSTTTTSAGTITAYTPDSDYIMFRTSADTAPVRYYYTKDTTILDPEGRTVTWSAVRPDTPATVYYTNVGDRVVVRKVVLSQPTTIYKKEQTTTTTTKEP